MRVYRLEFLQPDGRWTGPYCAEWMTERAFEIRSAMLVDHHRGDARRPWPDEGIFLSNPGPDRLVCACLTQPRLREWFGRWFDDLLDEGGHVGVYDLPTTIPVFMDGHQVIYMQRLAGLVDRVGHEPPSPLVNRLHPSQLAASLQPEAGRD
jgi:hypothetical protein